MHGEKLKIGLLLSENWKNLRNVMEIGKFYCVVKSCSKFLSS
jgi:hypothetical protein